VRSASSLWNICEGSMANIWARKWCSGVWPFHLYRAIERSSKWKLQAKGRSPTERFGCWRLLPATYHRSWAGSSFHLLSATMQACESASQW
jgi:hypothetical protein